jgi:hypothetical protein
MSYALDTQSESKINWLQEKLRLRRLSRGITTTLVLLGIESTIAFAVSDRLRACLSDSLSAYLLTQLASGFLAVFMTSQAYSGFCSTHFAMVYTQMRSEQEKQTISKIQE